MSPAPIGQGGGGAVEGVDDAHQLVGLVGEGAGDGGQVVDERAQLGSAAPETDRAGLDQRGDVAGHDRAEDLDGPLGHELELGGLARSRR